MELLSVLLLATLAAFATAQSQQGVLVNGNSQLPACAQGCTALVQAAQACSGTNEATQSTWICFCQSAYLNTLRASATGVCDQFCTNPAENAQISTWYNSNCGSDNGASEHANDGTGAAAGGGNNAAATTSGASQPAATGSAGSANSQSGTAAGASNPGDWWTNHYQWIIMLIVLAIAFPLIAVGAVWLKRRHDRKADQMTTGFNAGVSARTVDESKPDVAAAGTLDGSGRNSPARTRDAFMPYGYGYSRSASRNASKTAVDESNVHPLARGQTVEGEAEKEPAGKGKKKALVREESNEKSESGGSWM